MDVQSLLQHSPDPFLHRLASDGAKGAAEAMGKSWAYAQSREILAELNQAKPGLAAEARDATAELQAARKGHDQAQTHLAAARRALVDFEDALHKRRQKAQEQAAGDADWIPFTGEQDRLALQLAINDARAGEDKHAVAEKLALNAATTATERLAACDTWIAELEALPRPDLSMLRVILGGEL